MTNVKKCKKCVQNMKLLLVPPFIIVELFPNYLVAIFRDIHSSSVSAFSHKAQLYSYIKSSPHAPQTNSFCYISLILSMSM